jgi:hypothetical protein
MMSIIGATLLGNMGAYISNNFEVGWQLCGMAEQGLFPAVFATRLPKFDSPIVSVNPIFLLITSQF